MKYLRRLIWFIASRLLLIVLILGLMVIAFYYAMNLTNVRSSSRTAWRGARRS